MLIETQLLTSVKIFSDRDRFKVHYYLETKNINDTIQVSLTAVLENISNDTIYYPKRNSQDAICNPHLPVVLQFAERKQYKLKENNTIIIPAIFSGAYGWDSLISIAPGEHILIQVKNEFNNNQKIDTVRFEFLDNILLHENFKEANIFFDSGRKSSLNPYSDSEFQYFRCHFIYLPISNTVIMEANED